MTLIIGLIALAAAIWFASRRDFPLAGIAALVALVAIPLSVTGPVAAMLWPVVPLVAVVAGLWFVIGRPRRSRARS